LTAPLMKAVHLATVQVYQNNQLIQSIQINDNVQIQEANIFERFFMWFKGCFRYLVMMIEVSNSTH
jgi:D-alanyl-D-alanine carboxypeptidase (penicillin-binding protein 5/6)